MSSTKKITFTAKIESGGEGSSWPVMKIPFNVEKEWGSRSRVSVKGTMNGFTFRTSIFPMGNGEHHMMINRNLRDGAKAKPGDTVTFTLEPDIEKSAGKSAEGSRL